MVAMNISILLVENIVKRVVIPAKNVVIYFEPSVQTVFMKDLQFLLPIQLGSYDEILHTILLNSHIEKYGHLNVLFDHLEVNKATSKERKTNK